MNSLLERLRRRLREFGRPLHEEPSSEGRRPSSRAPADDAPPPRTEIELSHPSRSADRTGSGEPARLPAQQPPPPTSTRLKAAVFSKKRHPAQQRPSGAIWGPTSFLDIENGATGHAKADRSTPLLFGSSPMPASDVSSPDVMSWPQRIPAAAAAGAAEIFAIGAEIAHQTSWTQEQPQTPADIPDSFAPPLGAAPHLEGATAIGLNAESLRHMLDELPPAFTCVSR